MKRFEGQAMVVLGASSGIGKATAEKLAGEGAVVVGVARDEARLRAVIESLPGSGHHALVADASDFSQLQPLLPLGKQLGGYAGGVLCAGLHEVRPLALLDADALRRAYEANVTTALNATRAVSKAARPASAGGAGLVWMSSVAAIRATAGFAAYSAAKGALVSAARVAAVELASRKIRVNVVVAGVVETPMSDKWLGALTPEQREAVAKSHPLGLGRPEDVADAAAFLVSSEARWMTGASIVVDGGLSLR